MDIASLKSIFVGNGLALLLLIMLRAGSSWSVYSETKEHVILRKMIWVTVVCCLADPLVFAIDGIPGTVPLVLNFVGNTCLFLGNLAVGYYWIRILETHMGVRISPRHEMVHNALLLFGLSCLLVNIFLPVVFSLENNVYHREFMYWLFFVIAAIFMADGVVIYFKTRHAGGVLKSFPVWLFIVPVVIGMIVQSVFYGISAIWPCVAIGLAGVMASIQNERAIVDTMTGIYNRFYLDYLKESIEENQDADITGIMIDLNDFKSINDAFGHATGDDALIATAGILSRVVGNNGSVIRYAGDEFVILLNTTDEEFVRDCVKNIRTAFDEFNERGGKPYLLSAAIGYASLDLTTETMNEFMNIIDNKMYENKRAYHGMEHR